MTLWIIISHNFQHYSSMMDMQRSLSNQTPEFNLLLKNGSDLDKKLWAILRILNLQEPCSKDHVLLCADVHYTAVFNNFTYNYYYFCLNYNDNYIALRNSTLYLR